MSVRRMCSALVFAGLLGCGHSGPRPYPGDTVHVELFVRTLQVPPETSITLRFDAAAPGAAERVPVLAGHIEVLAEPRMTLRFFENDRALDPELTIPLKREC